MRHLISFACLLLLTACASTTSTRPIAATTQPVFVKGTYMPGSNITEPRPRTSQFFKTDHAGFVVLKKGAAYYLQARVLKSPPSTYYVRIEYENPQDKSHPFVNDMELTPTMDGVRFSSPDVVWGIRNYQDYTIRASVFTSRESTQPIDTLIQPVRAYVDTTTDEVRVYNRMQEK
jgi:hypothetical protein